MYLLIYLVKVIIGIVVFVVVFLRDLLGVIINTPLLFFFFFADSTQAL